MDDNDLAKFEKIYRRAYLAAQAKWKAEDYAERLGMYFRQLRCAPVEDVATAAATWFKTNKRFPAIADWLALLTHRTTEIAAPTNQRVMGMTEIAEWEEARKRKYHRPPCTCVACETAGVDTLEQRFVPIEDRDGYVQAWHSVRKELVYVGEWIHGYPLKRWYEAKQACGDCVANLPPQLKRIAAKILPVNERLDKIVQTAHELATREPGEDDE